MNNLTRSIFLSISLAITFALLGLTSVASGQDAEYRAAMAKAVRNAANSVLPTVVSIEIIGGPGTANGEVEQDAPTSGIVIDKSGYVIASSIVVRKPSASLLVVLPDRTRHAAKVVAKDSHRDLVLLKIDAKKELAAVDFPESFGTRVGETTIAVGRYGSDISPMVSAGILSATERLDGIALQCDARVSPALYGGPLISLSGEFLGVMIPAVAKGGAPDATSWYDSGIAFAIPSDVLKKKLDRLKAGQDISRGLIGIVPKSDDPLKLGTELAAIRTRSPAEKAGLKPGDEIVSIDKQPVKRFQEIKQALGRFDAGEIIAIEYKRGSKTSKIEIELADKIPPLQPQLLGFIARETTAQEETTDEEDEPEDEKSKEESDDKDESEEGEDANTDEDANEDTEDKIQVVVAATIPGTPASEKLESGDVIVSVDGAEIGDTQSLRRLLVSAEPDKPMKIVYVRDEKESEASLTPVSLAGDARTQTPELWESKSEKEWKVSELKLPDEGNAAAFVGPSESEDLQGLGLLVMLLNPGDGKPKEVLESWQNSARDFGVVVCAIAPSGDERWRPKEIDIVSRFAAAVLKKAAIEESAVAIAAAGALEGEKAEASDSMALAVAISASETFHGVAISEKARPPAVRLRENEADESLQVLLPIKSKDDMPTWGTALEKVGYPIIFGGATDQEILLKWTRLLQSI